MILINCILLHYKIYACHKITCGSRLPVCGLHFTHISMFQSTQKMFILIDAWQTWHQQYKKWKTIEGYDYLLM